MSALRHLTPALAELEQQGLLRVPPQHDDRAGVLVLCSNDYLGYAAEPPAAAAVPAGAGASRLVSGDHPSHRRLERALAEWVGLDEALLFTSGYAANVGAIAALAGPEDTIVSDERNHASIIDGCRLSGAEVRVTGHVDADDVARALGERSATRSRRTWVVTESYYSMDGTTPDLGRLRSLCDQHDAALVVDEAHALGLFGPGGSGLCRAAAIRPDVLVGTLGKAVGLQGAFVAGEPDLRRWLWNRARTFVFSTGMSPWLAALARDRVAQIRADDEGRTRLFALVARVRAELHRRSAPIGGSHGPILFWRCGEPAAALAASAQLLEQGVFAQAIRPPTVPSGMAGLRITLGARLSDGELDRAIAALTTLLP